MKKNIEKSSIEEINIDNKFFLVHFENNSHKMQRFEKDIDSSFIQLHFCLKGSSKFLFNNGSYSFNVLDKHSILLYNPQQKLPINLEINAKTTLFSLLISINEFHALFSKEANHIHFLSDENIHKKYYTDDAIKPSVLMVLQQIINSNVNETIKELYLKGKIYELLSLQFQKENAANEEFCPFLADEQNVLKIRKAKEIIIARVSEPPTLQELANEVGITLKKLKEGFKQIYGDTVYGFLLDYKLEYARKLLESNQLNVNEVGLKIGYSTSSHFIAAFKKKFGVTPKKHILSLQNK